MYQIDSSIFNRVHGTVVIKKSMPKQELFYWLTCFEIE